MNTITVLFDRSKGMIAPEIYGHFSEHIGGVFYDGLWVGEDSGVENYGGFRKALVDSFKRIAPPVLRWPGGCFAETYDWRDGIGPRAERPVRANWWYSRDHRTESNAVGTHEFVRLCRLVGAEPYFAANMTTLTPLHIRNWVEYCDFPANLTTLAGERGANGDPEPFNVRYWGIGNENWGGGGQMTPETCADKFIQYTTVLNSLGLDLRYIMCGGLRLDWTQRLMREWASRDYHETVPYGLSIHHYTSPKPLDDPHTFDENGWYSNMRSAVSVEKYLLDNRAVMDAYDPDRKITLILDEWGNWHREGTGPSRGYNLFEQQSNMRDAVVTALSLNIFNNQCDILGMANVAQLCNNLHCLFLARGNDFTETPTYHVFDMFQNHQGGEQLHTIVSCNARDELELISASASRRDGRLTVTLANLDVSASQDVRLSGLGQPLCGRGELRLLRHADPHTCNTFENPHAVEPSAQTVDVTDGMTLTLPAASVAALAVELP